MKSFSFHRAFSLLTGIALFVTMHSAAQQSNTFYLLHDVPQSNLLNPAVQIKCRWFLGIPGLSSTHLSYSNTAFTYMDLTRGNTWNLEDIEGQMHRVDLYGVEVNLQLLSLGYRYKSFYFNFSVNERAHLYQTIPKDLVTTAVYGNGPFVGKEAVYDPTRSSGTYLREYAFGASKILNSSLTLGVRAKLLFGKAGISTGRSDLGLYTGEDSFSLLAEGNYMINTSMPITVEQDADGTISGVSFDEMNYAQFLLNRGNPGLAVDLGMVYRYNDKLTLSASLLDIGMIRWSTDLNNIYSQGSFVFDELPPGNDAVSMDFLDDMIDSLRNSFNTSVSQNPYSTLLPMQLYLGGSYQVKEKLSVGVVNRNLFFRSKLHSSLTLSATAGLTKNLLGTLSWSLLNNSVKNLGAGLTWRGNGFQFHLVSENLLGFLQPFDTRTINLRAGCNILFGCPRNKKEELEAASRAGYSVTGDCSWAGQQKKRKKRYRNRSGI